MRSNIKKFCDSCDVCQRYKSNNHLIKAPLKQIVINRIWQIIGMDFMGPFNKSDAGNMYIILAIDYFSKLVEGVALPVCNAKVTARFVFDEIICRYGVFEGLLSDQGPNFESLLLKQLCQSHGVTKLRTYAYHPECNGLVERTNRTIKQTLRTLIQENKADWDLYLKQAICAYNFSNHTSTGFSPYKIVFGRDPVSVMDSLTGSVSNLSCEKNCAQDYVTRLKNKTKQIHDMVNKKLVESRLKQKLYYDRNTKVFNYKVGELVLVRNMTPKIGMPRSFLAKYLGPYRIKKIISDVSLEIQKLDSSKSFVVHVNRLKKYKVREFQDTERENKIYKFLFDNFGEEEESQKLINNGEVTRENNESWINQTVNQQNQAKPTTTRSGRVVKPVDRLTYFS